MLLLLWFRHGERMNAWITLDLLGLFGCSHPLNFTVLWSSYASGPSGYSNIAWRQSPVNQISSDLVGPADKTLHRRKWQTAGDKRPVCGGAMMRDWSTSPQTRPGCLHVLCLIWFSILASLAWASVLFSCQQWQIPPGLKSTIFKRLNGTFRHYTTPSLGNQLRPPNQPIRSVQRGIPVSHSRGYTHRGRPNNTNLTVILWNTELTKEWMKGESLCRTAAFGWSNSWKPSGRDQVDLHM